jgi:hypothetical protein
MTVTEAFDRAIRARIRELLHSLLGILPPDSGEEDRGLTVADGAPAEQALLCTGGLWQWVVAGLGEAGGADPVLSRCLPLLYESIDGMALAGDLQVRPVRERIAGFGPVVRVATESAVTAAWLVKPDTPEERLARAGIVELKGVESQIAYLADEAGRRIELEQELRGIAGELDKLLGAGAVRWSASGKVTHVFNQHYPKMMERYEAVFNEHEGMSGRAAYVEQSLFSHPVGYRDAVFSEPLSESRGTRVVHTPRSTVHDEGRLAGPALMALGIASAEIGKYVGVDLWPAVRDVTLEVAAAWNR